MSIAGRLVSRWDACAAEDRVGGASAVAVAGTFNQWSTSSHPLSRDPSSGTWTALVALAPGEHLFMYVVDGTEWLSPPAAEDYVDDGFGAWNGVVVVR